MSFQRSLAKYKRLYDENIVWKLLRAKNSPLIFAFIERLFSDGQNEVPYNQARILLDAELTNNLWEADTTAATYINQWVRDGWLREMDNNISKTDACEIALRFCHGLDERSMGTSASHLRIVQEAVKELVIALSTNPDDKINLLMQQKQQLEKEIAAIQAGEIVLLSEQEQRERLREIYQLASVLTGDFRRVEDEIRQLDQDIRIKMIESDSSRGDVLLAIMEQESLLAQSDAGSAFEGFFQLLCDPNRSTEFKEQLRTILQQLPSTYLATHQQKFLFRLVYDLNRESERIFQIRRKTEESLRTYIENDAVLENRAVDRLLMQLERLAINFSANEINLKQATDLILPSGNIQINSPSSVFLKEPQMTIEMENITEHTNSATPSSAILTLLDTVQIKEVAAKIYDNLITFGPMTIAELIDKNPVTFGLEELVAYLRVAKHIQSTDLNDKETVIILDKQGCYLNVSIPKYLLSASLFPDNIEELTL